MGSDEEDKREGDGGMNEMIATSRSEAEEWELPTYETGKACLRGHVAKRLTCNGACTVCLKEEREEYKKGLNWRELMGDRGGKEKAGPQKVKMWKRAAAVLEEALRGWRVTG